MSRTALRKEMEKDVQGYRKLHLAVFNHDMITLNQIVNSMTVPLDVKTVPQGLTPLMIASQLGYWKICQYLLLKGADPEMRDNQGKTALIWAVYYDHFTTALVIQSFLKNSVSVISILPRKKTDGSIKRLSRDQLKKVPLRNTTGIYAHDHSRQSAFTYAILNLNVKLVNFFVFRGAEMGVDSNIFQYPKLRSMMDAFQTFYLTVKDQRIQYGKTPLFTLQSFAYFFFDEKNDEKDFSVQIYQKIFSNFMLKYNY